MNNNFSATLGDRLQSSGISSKSGGKKPVTRASHLTLLKKRPANTSVSLPAVVDLTVDSSNESPPDQHASHETRISTPMEKRLRLHDESLPVTFGNSFLTPGQSSMDTCVSLPPITQPVVPSTLAAGLHQLPLDVVDSEGPVLPGKSAQADPYSSLPSLSLPAQPVTDDSEGTRTSSRSKRATKFFGDPLRHSVKSVEEDKSLEKEADILPSKSVLPSSQSPKRRPLLRDRSHLTSPEAPFSSSLDTAQDGN